jgi:methionyl-tRNA synthetase
MSHQVQYITTTLPYVNSKPHVGFAMEIIRADAIARYKTMMGYDVFFNTGTDEHGQKLLDDATASGEDVRTYVDRHADLFRSLCPSLGISESVHFIRTTDAHHEAGAQELWRRVRDNGFIYKSRYQTKYCVGCELEKSDSELVDGQCPIHPTKDIQLVDEENYFFKFSAFEQKLLDYYESCPDFVVPDFRFNEIKSFVKSGLQDFSISRLKSKMSWGVPVPDDEEHVMYVWFDALANYITTLGWPEDADTFNRYWVSGAPVQYCGQDNLRQQAAMWQAMLMAAELPTSRQIHINGFIMGADGRKMSKSIGNVVDPIPLIEHYGSQALRYYLLHYVHPYDGSPMSHESFHDRYTADLVNGIGNLTSRLLNMSEKYIDDCPVLSTESLPLDWLQAFESYRPDTACEIAMRWVSELDGDITKTEPFKLIKVNLEQTQQYIREYVARLYTVACMLEPIMPDISARIIECIKSNKKPESPLFPRLEMIES